ncbi:hypothetical protein PHMEG_0002182 [Phytophthora megakarya]|uniref:Uncharacterized protein n=1 Tax=Phytophthora megakarya TaxID=4795 RepID=A0A225WYU2_9STRA|nr:hypothetical protein PHMEG_0002182 [Phytophthora megakarya]
MVLLRARRTKLTATLRSDNDDGFSAQHQAQIRQENRRRGALYDLSSPSGKQLPIVHLQPADVRIRRDLMRLAQQSDKRTESEKKCIYEDEQNDCKHREHLNYRPPLDHIQKLRDLHTTVAKDCRGQVKLSAEQRMFAKLKHKFGARQYEGSNNVKTEWRLGYRNNVDTGSRAGTGGTFEPRDTTRERILDARCASTLLPDSVAVAYPLKNSKISNDFVWQESENEEYLNSPEWDSNQFDNIEKENPDDTQQRRTTKKKPWCPASSSKPPRSTSRRRYLIDRFMEDQDNDSDYYDHDGLQRFPIRNVETFEPTDDMETEFAIDAQCARRQQTVLTKAVETYSRVRARIDRLKDPHRRYELPVENAKQHPRAYRLGLDEVPFTSSTKPKKCKEKLRFRPKSAGTSVGFQTTNLAPKVGDLLTPQLNGVAKVAGARLRPHSASITYFKHSTIYCMEPPLPSKSDVVSAATDFRSVRSAFERMTLDEYMSACGCLSINTPSSLPMTENAMKETKRFFADLNNIALTNSGTIPSVDTSPSLIATRKTLVVSRQQFHLALEPFNLSSTDVNLLFSALDLTVSDFVQVWDVMCTVESIQHEHAALRRARVQQLQAPPTKDLDFFRRPR